MQIPPINYPNVPQFGASPNDPIYDLLEYLEGPNGLLQQMKNDPNFPGDVYTKGGWADKIEDLQDKLYSTVLNQLQAALQGGKITQQQYDDAYNKLDAEINAIVAPIYTLFSKTPPPTKDDLTALITQLTNSQIPQFYADYLDLIPH